MAVELDSGLNLVHVHTVGTHGRLDLAITLRSDFVQARQAQDSSLRDGLFAGIFLANLFLAFWLCLVVRKRAHYWYAAYQATTLAFLFCIHHHAFAWLWPEILAFNLVDRTLSSILIFAIAAKFLSGLLDFPFHFPRLGRLQGWMANALLVCGGLQLLQPWWTLPFELLYRGNRIEVLEISTYGLALCLLAVRVFRGDRLAMLVALASAPMAFAMAVGVGAEISHLPWMMQWRGVVAEFGLVLENLGLSLILVQKVVRERRSHQELLERHLALEQEFSRRLTQETDRNLRDTALDLHDGVGQELTGMGLWLRTMLRGQPDLQNSVSREMGKVMESVRRSAHRIYPPELMDGGFGHALERLAQSLHRSGSVRLEVRGNMPDLDEERALHWYRIAQETVNNALLHGKARHVLVELEPGRLRIENDGKPLPHQSVHGLGLRSIRRRAAILGKDVRLTDIEGGVELRVE